MPSGPIFEATWARCLQHKTLLEPGEERCFKCQLLERNLSLVPPFKVYCTHDEWEEVKTGDVYEVVWVIKSGRRNYGDDLAGYVFKFDDESMNDHVFDAENFIPVEFLTENNKDSWVKEEPAKVDNNPVLTEEDMMGYGC
jgi:hypothetical protein